MATTRGGKSRFSKSTEALRGVLGQLPDGVWVSLRVFGDEESGKDKATGKYGGIRLLWKAHRWEKKKLAERMSEVERLTPKYGTPLVRSIAQAKGDFPPGFTGPRTIVVVTDGGDSNFYDSSPRYRHLDADLRRQSPTLTGFLQKQFKDSGIQLSVVGFEVDKFDSAAEKQAHAEIQQALKKLDPPGAYYDAKDSKKLAVDLQKALLPMYFWVTAGLARPDPEPGQGRSIRRSDQNPNWIPAPSESSVVRVPSIRSLSQRVRVDSGDSLLLDLVSEGGQWGFRRSLYTDTHYIRVNHGFVRRAPTEAGWRLTALENYQVPEAVGLEVMVALEKESKVARPDSPLRQVRPGWTWFEVPAPAGEKEAPPLRVTSLAGYPAPAWGLGLRRWPSRSPATLQAWWLEGDPPVAGRLLKLTDFKTPFRLANHPWPTEAGKVVVEGVRHEACRVETSPGKVEQVEDCLVVRLRYPAPGEPFFVRLQPEERRGEEHRFHSSAGHYTGIFWPVSKEQADKITALQLISVAACKEKALGGKKLELGQPNQTRRPAP
jgi:hypothetical protein